MAEVLTEIVEGWTGALPFTLDADGAPIDLTGLTVQIVLRDCHGTLLLDSSSGVAVTSNTGGAVTYTAHSTGTFVRTKTPYLVRFRVTDGSAIVYFPNSEEDLIRVHR